MMCQRMGYSPTSTIGFGLSVVSSDRRLPRPPARIPTFIAAPCCFRACGCRACGCRACGCLVRAAPGSGPSAEPSTDATAAAAVTASRLGDQVGATGDHVGHRHPDLAEPVGDESGGHVVGDLLERAPLDLGGFVGIQRQSCVFDVSGEVDVERLLHQADRRVVAAEQLDLAARDPAGLLVALATRRGLRVFAGVDGAAGDLPLPLVGHEPVAVDHQDPALVVEHHHPGCVRTDDHFVTSMGPVGTLDVVDPQRDPPAVVHRLERRMGDPLTGPAATDGVARVRGGRLSHLRTQPWSRPDSSPAWSTISAALPLRPCGTSLRAGRTGLRARARGRARRSASSTSLLRSPSSVSNRSMARASGAASNGGTSRPVTSCSTNSGRPPAFVPITGVRTACASSALQPERLGGAGHDDDVDGAHDVGDVAAPAGEQHPVTEHVVRRRRAVARRTPSGRCPPRRRRPGGPRPHGPSNCAIASTRTWTPLRTSIRPRIATSGRSTSPASSRAARDRPGRV